MTRAGCYCCYCCSGAALCAQTAAKVEGANLLHAALLQRKLD